MKRAVMRTLVTREAAADGVVPPLPPADWFVRGPRGGLYIATGERTRMVGQDGEDYMRDTWTVVDRSEGARYVRPGSRLAMLEAQEA